MRLKHFLRYLVLFATALTIVQGDGDSGDSGEEEEGQGYGDGEDDGMGFFNYNDEFDFSEYAIYPLSCITDSDGSNVVFELYGEGHNQCSKKSVGTYKTSVQYFVTAYVKQKQQEAEMSGGDYEVDEEAIGYLYCTQFVYNNNYFFVQLGCREGTGKGFQIHSYSDQYCTEKMESQNYNLGIDTSSIMVGFEYCKNCQYQSQYANNNNNNNNNQNNYYGNYAYNEGYRHDSPLCGGAYNYKETCNRSCKRAAKSGSSSNSSGSASFSTVGKIFLWLFSFSAFFFLLAALAQRKKLSKSDAVLEDAAVKSAGLDKKFIPRIIIAYALFIIFLILFKRKILTWFFLLVGNVGLLWYYCHLQGRNNENKAAANDFQSYKGEVLEVS